ncbi:MAG: chloride channel protein [Bacteroidales bacterium]|nr:chloride channel protein [Bacteroidales bacterium]
MKKIDWRELYMSMLTWREQHIKESYFVLILSFVVGMCAAVAAFVLKSIIALIQRGITSLFPVEELNYWYLALPALGITLASLFVRYVVKDDISHGVTKILYAISQRKAIIKVHNMWSSVVASAITIGFGGSVGAEAPIVLTGSAIGSNLGRAFHLDQKTLMLLVGCGAAGAIGGIFNAPIAGVAFTVEVLMLDMTMTSVAPLLISAATATMFSYLFLGKETLFHFDALVPFAFERVPLVILLGIVCGLVSLYFTRGMNRLERVFKRLQSPYKKIVVGGAMLGLLIFLFPPLYGEGYDTIAELLTGDASATFNNSLLYAYRSEMWAVVLYLGLIVFFKIFASAATNGAGGTGGIFAPSLFVGSLTGFVMATSLNLFGFDIPSQNYAFVGMAGLMSGVMHAPLTGTFLIAELTNSYELLIPLIITSVVSYLTIILFEPHSLYAMRLAQKGELMTHHKDRAVLSMLELGNFLETDMEVVYPEMKLGELVKVISHSSRNVFPVVNKKTGVLVGIMPLDEVRNIMFRPDLYDRFSVRKLMIAVPARVNIKMPMGKVMDVFEDTGAWNLPVVDDDGRYVGFVSKSKIFNSYRNVLVQFSDE